MTRSSESLPGPRDRISKWNRIAILSGFVCLATWALPAQERRVVSIPASVLEDKLRGGLLGQILGDLNGLAHEMKYFEEPGKVTSYTPALPEGAWTDDDTDIEWIYILKIQSSKEVLLSPQAVSDVWKRSINRRFWCSHQYLRQLMDLGFLPPDTGDGRFNPWAEFNLSGQFVSETWGLISPGMPQTAARIGTHYTKVSVEGEAVQSTQLFASMIATAYLTSDIDRILDAGAASVDPKSIMRQIVADVRAWHKQNPADLNATRQKIKEKYTYYGGRDERDRNGVIVNGACTVAALLYGQGDFVPTMIHAFNCGWDADNNAATSGTIIGVIKGKAWFDKQGWQIVDRFRNTSRDNVPEEETITSLGDRILSIAKQVIADHGGKLVQSKDEATYQLRTEPPAMVEPLPDAARQAAIRKRDLLPWIERTLQTSSDQQELARAAYMAICLDAAPELKSKYAARWPIAIAALESYPKLLLAMFHQAPIPNGEKIRQRALAAGVQQPAEQKIW